jgi:hypothetical protein
MSDLSGLHGMIPIGDIARQLGVDEDVAQSAVNQVLPTLVAGLKANADDGAGAASLEKALTKHTATLKAKPSVSDIDTDDGEKIVSNIFGAKKNDVVAAVASKTDKADESLISKLLPILAPIVLSWLASQFFNKKETTSTKESSGGGIGDILGGLLGGGSSGGGDVLGGLLGGLLGGGKK